MRGTVGWFACDVTRWEFTPPPKIARPAPVRERPQYCARGRVFKRGETWFYEVSVGDRVVLADNTNDFRRMLDDCNLDVVVADRIVRSGHGFRRTWAELVDKSRP